MSKLNFSEIFFIALIAIFQILTLTLFYVGPWDFGDISIRPILYVVFYVFSLLFGFYIGGYKKPSGKSYVWNFDRLINICAVITLVFFIPTILARASVNSLLDYMQNPLSLGQLYSNSSEIRNNSESPIEYLRMLFFVPLTACFPLTLLFWRKITWKAKILAILAILSNVIIYISTRTNRILFDYLIISFNIIIFLYFRSLTAFFKAWRYVLGSMIFFILIFFFFSSTQSTREGSSAIYGSFLPAQARVKPDFQNDINNAGFIGLSLYLAQGYFALERSSDMPFKWTWGVGNSSFISRQVDRAIGSDFSNQTYVARLEEIGWDRYNNWSSFYVWWASDITFYGIVFLMFGIGFLVRISSIAMISRLNPYSASLFSQLVILVYYIPAKNQLFQSGEGFFAFLGTLIFFIVSDS